MSANDADLHVEVDLTNDIDAPEDLTVLIESTALRTIATEGLTGNYLVAVTLVTDNRIRELNRVHRKIDTVTDVLSFPLLGDDGAEFILPDGAPVHLGDVVLSIEQARRQAEDYGHAFEREIAYLTAHGVLHLLGHDHDEDIDRVEMRAREEEILIDQPRE